MQTSVKYFNTIPVRELPVTHYKYTDIVSYLVFIGLLPVNIIHALVIFPFVGFNLMLSYNNLDTMSELLEYCIRDFSTTMTKLYKFTGYLFSILLCGIYHSLNTYSDNSVIIKAMNPVSLEVVDFSTLPNVHRNAILKNGFIIIWLKTTIMFSILPTTRHILMYNPFLFKLTMGFTNQMTKDIPINERTDENFQLLEKVFHTYAGKSQRTNRLDIVDFNPNYNECDTDDGKFNSIGMQVAKDHTTYVQMELPAYKQQKASFDYHSPILVNGIKCKLLDRVWIPYSNPFHPIISYVEILLTEHGSVQHAMMGVFSDSVFSQYKWDYVIELFNINVRYYVEEQYEKNKLIAENII